MTLPHIFPYTTRMNNGIKAVAFDIGSTTPGACIPGETEPAGGCYGIRLGRAFFGESMFSQKTNASKAAFLTLALRLFSDGVKYIDCQVPTDHLISLGGVEISRKEFVIMLKRYSD